jgi:hypothetical protein
MTACVAGYIVLMTAVGRFVGLDEVFFKAPGHEWARTGRLAAPELTGFLRHLNPPIDPPIEEVWFVHPPVYPFLFGLFTRVAGFGPRQCVVYDVLIHALLAFLTFALARRLREGLPGRVCFGIGLAVLPVGIFCRPDELAMCFGMAGLLTLLPPEGSWGRVALSGVLFGLCAATSVGAAVLLGLVALTLLASSRRWLRGAGWAAAAAVAFAAAIAPVLIAHPGAYRQYLAHAADHVGRGNFLEGLFTHWENEQFHRSVTLACLLVAAASLVCRGGDLSWARWRRLWLGPLLGLGFLAAFLPDKIYYTWFFGPWMIVGAVVTWRGAVSRLHPAAVRGVALGVLGLSAIAVGPFAKNLVMMGTLPRSQTLDFNARLIRELIPPGSTVLTDDYWWVLADDCRVYDLYFARPDPEAVDYIILTGNGSGDSEVVREVPSNLAEYGRRHFRPVQNNINTKSLSLFGRTIPNTAFGFGAVVLARVK